MVRWSVAVVTCQAAQGSMLDASSSLLPSVFTKAQSWEFLGLSALA